MKKNEFSGRQWRLRSDQIADCFLWVFVIGSVALLAWILDFPIISLLMG